MESGRQVIVTAEHGGEVDKSWVHAQTVEGRRLRWERSDPAELVAKARIPLRVGVAVELVGRRELGRQIGNRVTDLVRLEECRQDDETVAVER
jgi:hypothetical protein